MVPDLCLPSWHISQHPPGGVKGWVQFGGGGGHGIITFSLRTKGRIFLHHSSQITFFYKSSRYNFLFQNPTPFSLLKVKCSVPKYKHLKLNFNVKFGIVLGTTSVLKDCPHPCTYNGHKFCEPIPCPPPPPNCTHPFTNPNLTKPTIKILNTEKKTTCADENLSNI
jgi:hypothetical protein